MLTTNQINQLIIAMDYCKDQARDNISVIYTGEIETDKQYNQQLEDCDALIEQLVGMVSNKSVNEYYNEILPSETSKALRQLEPLLINQVQWVQDMCRDLVKEAAAPSSWDEIIGEHVDKKEKGIFTITEINCSIGFYQDMAEQAYTGIDIEKLMDEATNN